MAIHKGPDPMKALFRPIIEGIKESFRLSAAIVLAVVAVLSAFTHHSLKDGGAPARPTNHASS